MTAPSRLICILQSSIIAAGLALIVGSCHIDQVTFDVSAETDVIRYEPHPDSSQRYSWGLRNAQYQANQSGDSSQIQIASGTLQFAPPVIVTVSRRSSGPLYIRLELPAYQHPRAVGMITFSDSLLPPIRLNAGALLTVDSVVERAGRGEPVVLPIFGALTVGGGALHDGAQMVGVRSGNVELLSRVVLRDTSVVVIRSVSLRTGDTFRVSKSRGSRYGMLVADERPLINVAYRALGTEARIERLHGQTRAVTASKSDVWTSDPFFQIVAGVVLLIVSLAVGSFRRAFRKFKRTIFRGYRTMQRTFAAVLLVGLLASQVDAQSVSVVGGIGNAESVGQGVTLPHGVRDCVVVLPLHVIASKSPPIRLMGDDGVTEEAGVPHFISLPDADLAILSLPLNHPFPCVSWNAQAVTNVLDGHQRPFLRWRQGKDVGVLYVDIISRGTRELAIVPTGSREELRKTMSGAQLMIGNVMVGILMEMDSVGRGRVVRSDWAEKLLPPFMPGPSTESWTVGDRDASLGFTADVHLLNTIWGGGLELGVPFTRWLDLLVHGGYIYRNDIIVDHVPGTGHITSAEVGPRFWATPRSRVVALYAKAAGIGSSFRASSDNGTARISMAGVMAGAGVSIRVLPRIFLSGEYQERRYWLLASTEEPIVGEAVDTGSTRSPILRFGITKYW